MNATTIPEIPGYTITRQIGKGGMATVYLAIQQSLNRQVALKVMDPALGADKNFTERFLKEGRIIGQFQHPQIITIYDFGSHNHYYYFSMEFLSGGTLNQKIEEGLPVERAVSIIKLIASALAYAHRQGVIHRDIKPQNILFRRDGSPVLSDFGIAKVVDSGTQLTTPGLTVGSPHYMSPEQVTGKKLDARSDLYSLGIVFYEMLTKRPPYHADDIISIAMMHCTAALPILPKETSKFQPILQKLLAKNPNERYENAEQLIQALEQFEVRPPSLTELPTLVISQPATGIRTRLRSKTSIVAGALLLLTVAAGTGTYLFLRPAAPPPLPFELPLAPDDRSVATADYERLAIEHFRKSEFGQSLELIRLGLNASPSDTRLLALREYVQNYQQATQLLAQAKQRAQDGLPETALQLVEQGLHLAPSHSGLLALRPTLQAQLLQKQQQQAGQLLVQARARQQQGALDDSLRLIEEGLRLVPNDNDLLALRTDVQAQQQRQIQASQLLTQARTRQQQGDLDGGLRLIEEGLALVPNEAGLLELRSDIQKQLDQRRRQQADQFLVQARERQQQGNLEESLERVNDGLALVPDHPDLQALRSTLRLQLDQRQQANRLLVRARESQQQGALDDSLKLIEQGLQLVPTSPDLLALRTTVQEQLKQQQMITQLLAQARDRQQQGELDESLKLIEQGLRLAPTQPDLLKLRDQVKTQLDIKNQIARVLRDCAARFRLDRLTADQGAGAVACYDPILELDPNNVEVGTRREQIANKYADWASTAILASDFNQAEAHLVQLSQIKADHPQIAKLRVDLQTKRQAVEEARRQAAEEEAKRKAAEEAKRQAAEQEAKRQAAEEAKRQAAEQEAKRQAAEEAKRQAAEEAKRQAAEQEAKRQAAEEAKRQAAEEAKRQAAEQEAKRQAAEREAKRQAAEEAKRQAAEQEAKRQAAEEAKRQAAEEAKRQAAEQEAKRQAAEEAQRQAVEAAKRQAPDEAAKRKATEEAKRQAVEAAKRQAAEEAKRQAAEEKARRKAAEQAKRQAAEEAKRQAAAERARRQAAEQAKRQAADEARRQSAEDARREATEDARRQAADAAKRQAAEQARRQAAEEAKRQATEQARRQAAAEEARRQAAEAAKRSTFDEPPVVPKEKPKPRVFGNF